MRILVDTSILVRTSHPDSQHFQAARSAVARLLISSTDACLVPQILYEYWVVATRPSEQNGLGRTKEQAVAKLNEYVEVFTFLDDGPAIFEAWRVLVEQHQVLGKNAHDTRLVAAMQQHGIPAILTLNARDFGRYPNIVVYTPESLPEDLVQLDDPVY